MSVALNFAAAVVVRALAVIFMLAIGAFVADILASDLGDLLGRGAFWLAVVIAVVWGIADGRVSRSLVRILLVWLTAAVMVAIGAGFVLKTVAERGVDESLSWFEHAWVPMLIALLPGVAGAAVGFVLRDRLPVRLQPDHLVDL